MSAAAMYADTHTAPDDTSGAGVPGWVILHDCENTLRPASERQPVEIVLNDEGRCTIDREVTLEATIPSHFVACYSENGVLMFGTKFPPVNQGDTVLLTPSGVFVG